MAQVPLGAPVGKEATLVMGLKEMRTRNVRQDDVKDDDNLAMVSVNDDVFPGWVTMNDFTADIGSTICGHAYFTTRANYFRNFQPQWKTMPIKKLLFSN